MKRVKKCSIFLLCLLTLCLCFGCAKKEAVKKEKGKETETVSKAVKGEKEEKFSEDTQALVDAIRATSELSSFQMGSEIGLNLNGNYIQLSAAIHADTEVVQRKKSGDLQMSSVSTSNQDDIVSYAYYKDGIYYTDDKKGKNKEEKSPEEVMQLVTDITGMVVDAAGEIENLQVKEEGDTKVYTYTIPSYLAETYLEQLAESAAAADTPLNGASAEVDSLQMVSTVDGNGLLTGQQATMAGTIKKSLFKIPSEASIVVDFQKTDKKSLDIPTW